MPRDTAAIEAFVDTPAKPDLSTPTLEGLAYILRHREEWPEGFVWDYRHFDGCACGLARERWSYGWLCIPGILDFALDVRAPRRWWQFPRLSQHTQPEHVAAAIDAHLAHRHTT